MDMILWKNIRAYSGPSEPNVHRGSCPFQFFLRFIKMHWKYFSSTMGYTHPVFDTFLGHCSVTQKVNVSSVLSNCFGFETIIFWIRFSILDSSAWQDKKTLSYTAKVYRELQGLYREIRLQGSLIYRDILCSWLLVIFVVLLQGFVGKNGNHYRDILY